MRIIQEKSLKEDCSLLELTGHMHGMEHIVQHPSQGPCLQDNSPSTLSKAKQKPNFENKIK